MPVDKIAGMVSGEDQETDIWDGSYHIVTSRKKSVVADGLKGARKVLDHGVAAAVWPSDRDHVEPAGAFQ